MKMSIRPLRRMGTMLAVVLPLLQALAAAPAGAADFPDKPVKIVVPFAAGGLTDALARRMAGHLNDAWRQPVIVENRPGASGNIGHEMVARAPGDGHTLLFTSGSFTINPSLFRNLGYDVAKDFKPVTLVATVPSLLLVPASSTIRSFQDFLSYAKSHPGKLNYGSAGNGSPQHLAMELLKAMAGLHVVHLPYKGGAPALADLIGGQTEVMFAAVPEAVPHVKSGRLRALAISSPGRSAVLPDVPTIAESGVAGFEAIGWQGLLAPGTTPAALVDRISADLAKALALPETRSQIDAMGIEFSGEGPAGFQRFLDREVKKWAEVVNRSGARID
ncbi:MAG: tripartite tricarboxylate transporter substrate binding protein [Lautropia sp.]